MTKKTRILCVLLLMGNLIVLTILGKQIEPHAQMPGALIVPFGARAWEKVILHQIDHAKTRTEVENSIGPATSRVGLWPATDHSAVLYRNPHDPERGVIVNYDSHEAVQSIGALIP